MDLTVELKKLQGKRLATLYQNKPFEITRVGNNQIILKTSTEAQRPIALKEIASAWRHLEKKKKLTRSEVRDLGFSEFNPAYVVAILASLPGVKHSLGPIILTLP
jgi:diketogulonate reductase-like aldo/keto reductase